MDLRPLASLFYVVQFDRDLNEAVDRLAQRAVSDDVAGFTRSELLALLGDALVSDDSLARFDMSGFERSELVVREFLRALHQRLSEIAD